MIEHMKNILNIEKHPIAVTASSFLYMVVGLVWVLGTMFTGQSVTHKVVLSGWSLFIFIFSIIFGILLILESIQGFKTIEKKLFMSVISSGVLIFALIGFISVSYIAVIAYWQASTFW